MKLRASGQDLRVTLISAGSIPGKRDIELQSETRTWDVFGCTSSLSSLYLCKGIARVWQEILSGVYKENARCSLLLDLCLYSSFSYPVTISLLSHAAFSTPFFRRSIFQTLSIILTLVDYTRARGILPWRRRVAASLKFHTRWPTYRTLHLGYAWLVHPNIRHPEYFLLRGVSHYTSPASSLFRSQHLRWVLRKTVYGKNSPLPDVYSKPVRNGSGAAQCLREVSRKLRTKSGKWRKVHRAERSLRSTAVLYLSSPSTER